MVILVAAVSDNGVIAKDGDIPWHLPEDLKAFRYWTTGKVVIMGRKTFESLPDGPLPDRMNVVLTGNGELALPKGVMLIRDLESALEAFKTINQDVMIIGGGEVYKQAIPFADELFITEVHQTIDGDDLVKFPEYDKSQFEEVARLAGKNPHIPFHFVRYKRKVSAQAQQPKTV